MPPRITTTPKTAHVGYTDTDNDILRMTRAEAYLFNEFKAAFFEPTGEEFYSIDTWFHHDVIDLNGNGESGPRDFLAESKKYDVIILHLLFNGSAMETDRRAVLDGKYANSQLHTKRLWQKRLLLAGPAFIIAFGGNSEVSYQFLGYMLGYKLHLSDSEKGVYVRNDFALTSTRELGIISI